jgi:hypothetical protein
MSADQERAAFDLLDQAIEACFAIDNEDGDNGVPVDAVLIIGCQHIEDDGCRVGHVEVYPRRGAQPAYITRGITAEATKLLDRAIDNETGSDDDD